MPRNRDYERYLIAAKARREKIAKMRREGTSAPAIAAKFGISRARVYAILSRSPDR